LGCDENEYELIKYIESSLSDTLDHPRGKEYLKYWKFGTLQYCIIRPCTAIAAMLLNAYSLYDEEKLGWANGNIYILLVTNLSVTYAFVVLASFYSVLKCRLKPFKPVGKFLCIKFVIFFSFWQSIVFYGMVYFRWIPSVGGYSATSVSVQLQDFLICLEMFVLAVAHLHTFSHRPFVASSPYRHAVAEDAAKVSMRERLLPQPLNEEGHLPPYKLSSSSISSSSSSTSGGGCLELQCVPEECASSGGLDNVGSVLSAHFAADSAIRDFNDSMPVVHIPTRFQVRKGTVIRSDPASRINELYRPAEGKQSGHV
jgi:hypothetical protein